MKALFFIGLTVPEPLSSKIQDIKAEFAREYHTRHGLLTIPHITLEPPFSETETGIQQIRGRVAEIARNTEPFEITLDGYGCFGKHAIYLKVLPNSGLDSLFLKIKQINPLFKQEEGHAFRPHITLAHRDLKAVAFDMAWKELNMRIFRESYKNESISMLVHRNGLWEIDRTFFFKEPGKA